MTTWGRPSLSRSTRQGLDSTTWLASMSASARATHLEETPRADVVRRKVRMTTAEVRSGDLLVKFMDCPVVERVEPLPHPHTVAGSVGGDGIGGKNLQNPPGN